jgi:LPXTG-motif cell wall-anchored protein
LRKLMMLGALLAMIVVAATPAIAQIGTQNKDGGGSPTPLAQEFSGEDVESGDVEPSIGIASKGDQVNLCANLLQSAQSGNLQNQQGLLQYKSFPDEIEFEGSTIEVTPELANECTQVIEQAAAAGEKAEAKAGKAEAKAGGGAEAKAGKAEAKAQLPKTGGVAGVTSLLALGAVALLVAGGLVARRVIR